MAAVAFDTLKLSRKLQDTAKMPQIQAEGVADALAEAMSGAELATKSDLRELELKIDGRFKEVDGRFKETDARIDALSARIDNLAERTEARFDALIERSDTKFEIVLERIDRRGAETEARMVRYVVGIGVTTILIVLGAIWAAVRFVPGLLPHP